MIEPRAPKPRLLFIVNDGAYFVSHRLPIAIAARQHGYDVHVATPGACPAELTEAGLQHHVIDLTRSGASPLREAHGFFTTFRLIGKLRPAIVHAVTIKPVIYGGIAARLSHTGAFIGAIAGLGTVFIAKGFRARLRRLLAVLLYRIAFGGGAAKALFQNEDDRQILVANGIVARADTLIIQGSGVALEAYSVAPEPPAPVVFTLASRLLRDKGVEEFIAAARRLREANIPARFRLIGVPDPGNPSSVSEADIEIWAREGVVELLGFRRDIAAEFAASHVVVLPSYREGFPKVLAEAAACGRATITTDVPGCRDAVVAGTTGLIVPPRRVAPLADAMQLLVENAAMRHDMGRAGRLMAEQRFGIEKVVEAHLAFYAQIAQRTTSGDKK